MWTRLRRRWGTYFSMRRRTMTANHPRPRTHWRPAATKHWHRMAQGYPEGDPRTTRSHPSCPMYPTIPGNHKCTPPPLPHLPKSRRHRRRLGPRKLRWPHWRRCLRKQDCSDALEKDSEDSGVSHTHSRVPTVISSRSRLTGARSRERIPEQIRANILSGLTITGAEDLPDG